MDKINPTSDPIYKRLYSFAEMVADLLRSILPADTLEALDLRSLEKVPAAYVGEDFHQRSGDTVWRVRSARADSWAYVLVLLEFQSSSDATMALRVNEYTVMLYRELLRAKVVEPSAGQLPPVLPVVLYNGESRWTAAGDVRDLIAPTGRFLAEFQPSQRYLLLDLRRAKAEYAGKLTNAVARLERSGTPKDLLEVKRTLAKVLPASRMKELRRAFADWLWALEKRLQNPGEQAAPPPPDLTLEDIGMTLEERVARWPDPWIELGERRGIEQGKRQGIEQGKRQGIELGERRGIVQGKQEQLRRLAEARFGEPTAQRLFASLQAEDDPQRLDEIAVAVVRCETADELLRRAVPGGPAANPNA